ncbi:hypothetical protein DFH01_16575 [Falsiroseomonas bella]|uniref:HEPN domain-containing protein n=2 Tax=Falsiroseomonas bella TaxID=2184016 RepID=A0A317FCZ2_9PROT|nr:hypothetical protein DFH01_16575 [Falsiroseomonas bella]
MFLQTADENYIMARTSFFSGFGENFFWMANHAIEKYLKALNLFLGGHANYGHEIEPIYAAILAQNSDLEIRKFEYPPSYLEEYKFAESPDSFLARLGKYGSADNRYGTIGYRIFPDDLHKVDHCVFHFRRFCRSRYTYHLWDNGREERIDWYELTWRGGFWSIDPLGILEQALKGDRRVQTWVIESAQAANCAFLRDMAPEPAQLPSRVRAGAFVDWMFPLDAAESSEEDVEISERVLEWALKNIRFSRRDTDAFRLALRQASRTTKSLDAPPSSDGP